MITFQKLVGSIQVEGRGHHACTESSETRVDRMGHHCVSAGTVGVRAAFFYPLQSATAGSRRLVGAFSQRTKVAIQGPGFGFCDEAPHEKLLSGVMGDWSTDACGFTCDFLATWGKPVIYLDLGRNRDLSEISWWDVANADASSVKEFSLRFATSDDGSQGYGHSILFNPRFANLSIVEGTARVSRFPAP